MTVLSRPGMCQVRYHNRGRNLLLRKAGAVSPRVPRPQHRPNDSKVVCHIVAYCNFHTHRVCVATVDALSSQRRSTHGWGRSAFAKGSGPRDLGSTITGMFQKTGA